MGVDKSTVEQIARLARIRVSDEEAAGLQSELSDILDWVEQLSEVDTNNVEPMTQVVAMPAAMRDDIVNDGGKVEAVTDNAPLREKTFFVVPKVVE